MLAYSKIICRAHQTPGLSEMTFEICGDQDRFRTQWGSPVTNGLRD